MIQVSTVMQGYGAAALLESLQHIRAAHGRNMGAGDRIYDLVLTDVTMVDPATGRPTEELNLPALEIIRDFLPDFENVFFGTISEVLIADPYDAGIRSEGERWRYIGASSQVAHKLKEWLSANVPEQPWHWYISYEANLNDLARPDIFGGYSALLRQMTSDLAQIQQAYFLWSPTFWTNYSRMDRQARNVLARRLQDLFTEVPAIDWLHFQDHIGAAPTFSVGGDVVPYFHLLRQAAPHLRSLGVNMEYFAPDFGLGNPAEQERRMQAYRVAGVPIGSSFELRFWRTTHQECSQLLRGMERTP